MRHAAMPVNVLKRFAGKRVQIDAMCWVHRIAIKHAIDVVMNKKYDGVVDDFGTQAAYLVQSGVIPTFVFDGGVPDLKEVRHSRSERRTAALHAAELMIDDDFIDYSQLTNFCKVAISIKWDLVHLILCKLRELGIPFMIAPMEADTQLAMNDKLGLFDDTYSEDADMFVHIRQGGIFLQLEYIHRTSLGLQAPVYE